ncbi:hypothetical protein [Fodinibius sp. SL11]|uniref:hypothetical protein n=1 Tax=Fodinibius sp. SL11 TaxID=3425690 RepID=UPI003F882044
MDKYQQLVEDIDREITKAFAVPSSITQPVQTGQLRKSHNARLEIDHETGEQRITATIGGPRNEEDAEFEVIED